MSSLLEPRVSPIVHTCMGLFFGLVCSLAILSIIEHIDILREARKRGVSTVDIGAKRLKFGKYFKRFTIGRLAYSKFGLILTIFLNLIIIILSLVFFAWYILDF